jgi:hypothetical protein
MKLASHLIAGLAFAAGLALSSPAQAQDGALMSSSDFYFNGTIGGSALIFSGSSNVAKSYYGLMRAVRSAAPMPAASTCAAA